MGSPDWCAWRFTESPQPGAVSFSLKLEVVWYEEASRVDVCFLQEREGEHLVLRLNLAYRKKDRAPADRRQISSWNSAQTVASKHLPSSPVSTVVSFLQSFLGNSRVLFNQSKCLLEIRLSAVFFLKHRDVMERKTKIHQRALQKLPL